MNPKPKTLNVQVLYDELMVGSGSADWPQAYSVITLALMQVAPHTNPGRTPLGKESLERGRKRELSKLAVYSSLSKVNIFAFCFSECQHSVMTLASPRMLMRPRR